MRERGAIWPALLACLGMAAMAAPASAATLSVDDDGAECPAAAFTSVQAAVDAAAAGDTVAICPGTYEEGTGTPGTNALTITKSLTLKGAGAELVTISPQPQSTIADPALDLRNGVGDIIAIGAGGSLIDVDISGVTVDGAKAYVEAGIVFLDAQGSITRSHVTNVVTSEAADASTLPGGYRSNFPGVGVAHLTASPTPANNAVRELAIDHSRVDKYNRDGVLIDGLRARGVLTASEVVGRTQCFNYTENGNCSSVGLLTTGTLFGQDGVEVNTGSASITSSSISQNLVNGTGAPSRGTPLNNANLRLGAGVRLVNAAASTISRSNIVANAYGVYNVLQDGSSANTTTPVVAEDNWWGLNSTAAVNTGPAVSPASNPSAPENPVNGTARPDADATPDEDCPPPTGNTSTAVDFFPYRNGSQGDANCGQWPVVGVIPANDAAPSGTLSSDKPAAARGSAFTLTAGATDDFGVKEVTFYEGASVLGTDSTPPYTYTVAVTEDAPLGSRSFSAVAEDSAGQTATSGTTAVEVTEPPPAQPPTPPSDSGGSASDPGQDSASDQGSGDAGTPGGAAPQPSAPSARPGDEGPSVTLTAPAKISAKGSSVTAAPSAPAGVARVDFFLGNRKVCTVASEPFACHIRPTGAEVGRQVLRVVVTDTAGASAETSRDVVVRRFRADALALKVKRSKQARRVVTLVGRLLLPSAVTPAQGCGAGTVELTLKRGKRSVTARQVGLRSDCTYRGKLRAPGRRWKGTATARFGGNTVLTPVSTKARRS